VPHTAELVVIAAEYPTTGGYPVIGIVAARDVHRLSQFVTDAAVTFAWSD